MTINRIRRTAATEISREDGVRVLISYQTPVAAYVPGRGRLRTSNWYSVTTTRHTNAWLARQPSECAPEIVDPEVLVALLARA